MSATETSSRRNLDLGMEVSGCACTCIHCCNQGHPYKPMALSDIERILAEGVKYCEANGLSFCPYAMHDAVTHPHALKVIQLFHSYGQSAHVPVTTSSGPSLALHPDIDEFLAGLKSLGTNCIWLTLHGIDEIHDRAIGRKGAFEYTKTAIARSKSAGMDCGIGLYISAESIEQIPRMIEFCRANTDRFDIDIVTYFPNPRLRAYESIRPHLPQLAPYVDTIVEALGTSTEQGACWRLKKWGNLDEYSEAHWVEQAVNGVLPEEAWRYGVFSPAGIDLVCKNNGDLHTGQAGMYGALHGNLLTDGIKTVFDRAVDYGPVTDEQIFFPGEEIPGLLELARKWGDPQGQKIYGRAGEMRMRWLDLALGNAKRDEPACLR